MGGNCQITHSFFVIFLFVNEPLFHYPTLCCLQLNNKKVGALWRTRASQIRTVGTIRRQMPKTPPVSVRATAKPTQPQPQLQLNLRSLTSLCHPAKRQRSLLLQQLNVVRILSPSPPHHLWWHLKGLMIISLYSTSAVSAVCSELQGNVHLLVV